MRKMDGNTSLSSFIDSMCDGEIDDWGEELHLQIRIWNVLKAHGVKKLGQILHLTEKDFLKIPHLGKGSVKLLMKYLEPVKATGACRILPDWLFGL